MALFRQCRAESAGKQQWGNSSQFNFWSSGPLVDDSVSLQVRGSTQQRQGSSVTSLSDTAATRIPYPTESQNYNLGARLDWKASAQDVLWFDMDTTRQRYDNRDGQLGSLTGDMTGPCAMSETKFQLAMIILSPSEHGNRI